MKLFAALRRLLRILFVVIRYRLDDLLYALPLPWWLDATRYLLPWRWLPRRRPGRSTWGRPAPSSSPSRACYRWTATATAATPGR